jgi:hypothetical protein
VVTSHSSKVFLNPVDGSFQGNLRGTFTITTLSGDTVWGEMKASIEGEIVDVVIIDGAPVPIYQVFDSGRWRVTGGSGNLANLKVKGNFEITLGGILGIPASWGGLQGGGFFSGTYKTKG